MALPLGSGNLSSSETDPEAALFWMYQGTLDWFGTAKYSVSGDRYKLENAVGINLSLGQITGAYVEYKGTFPEGAGAAHDLNLDLTWLLDPNVQIDLNGGSDLIPVRPTISSEPGLLCDSSRRHCAQSEGSK
jgi:hypothetical protein